MKKTLTSLLIAFACLSACAADTPIDSKNIIGHWRSNPPSNFDPQDISFKPNGKLIIGTLDGDQSGTYVIKGNILSINSTNCSFSMNSVIKDDCLVLLSDKGIAEMSFKKVSDSEIIVVRNEARKNLIQNNLRQISAALDLYFLEKKADFASYDEIVGEGKYVKKVKIVDGEDYRKLDFTKGAKKWTIVSTGGIEVTINRQ